MVVLLLVLICFAVYRLPDIVIVYHNSFMSFELAKVYGELSGNHVSWALTEESGNDGLEEIETKVRKTLCINAESCIIRG